MNNEIIKGKWALVTGSSRGIGQQIIVGLAKLGCNVIVHGRKLENTVKTLNMIKDYNVDCFAVKGELSNKVEIDKIVEIVNEKTKGIDILYNNAAVMAKNSPIFEIPTEEWERVFSINFYAIVNLCNAFAPGMRKRKFGRIINTTSGMQDLPNLCPYSISKAAVEKYSRELAFELKDDNVLVNYLDPGWLRTDLGGPNADHSVETVVPGALVPALLEDNGPSGRLYGAQDYKYLK